MGRHVAEKSGDLDIRDFIRSEREPAHRRYVPVIDAWTDPEDLKAQRHDYEYAQSKREA